MNQDTFYHLIEENLNKKPKGRSEFAQVVHESVAQYIFRLMNLGHVPQKFLDILERDLKEEAWEFLRKKAYGHLNLDSFQTAKKTVRRKKTHSA
jgi:hypothetical protein